MNRIFTKPTIFQRIRRSRIIGVLLIFAMFIAAGAAAEALCDAVDASYDSRIEVAA